MFAAYNKIHKIFDMVVTNINVLFRKLLRPENANVKPATYYKWTQMDK